MCKFTNKIALTIGNWLDAEQIIRRALQRHFVQHRETHSHTFAVQFAQGEGAQTNIVGAG